MYSSLLTVYSSIYSPSLTGNSFNRRFLSSSLTINSSIDRGIWSSSLTVNSSMYHGIYSASKIINSFINSFIDRYSVDAA
jgi:hypothetical protein